MVETQIMPELLLAYSTGCVDLVTKDKERNLGEFLDREKSIQFSLGFRETLKVGRVNEEDDTIDFREIVTPESAGYQKKSK